MSPFFIIFIVDVRKAIVFLILILIIQIIDGNIIAPKILGESTGVSSLGVIVAIVIGSYFGIVGMLVAIPIFATITAIIRDLASAKLIKAGLPEETSEYYSDDSLVDPHEEHESLSHKLFQNTKNIISRIKKIINKKSTDAKNNYQADEIKKETSKADISNFEVSFCLSRHFIRLF